MGVAVISLLLVVGTVVLIRTAMRGLVCPFCEGPIHRAFEKTQCRNCGRLFYLWQAKRK